jgi:hypothetical protein
MILSICLIATAFLLWNSLYYLDYFCLRRLTWHGWRGRLCMSVTVLAFVLLIVGLVLSFVVGWRIGLTVLGGFLIAYNASTSASPIPGQGVVLLSNSLALLMGILALIAGLIFSLLLSWHLFVAEILGLIGAMILLRLLTGIEWELAREIVRQRDEATK